MASIVCPVCRRLTNKEKPACIHCEAQIGGAVAVGRAVDSWLKSIRFTHLAVAAIVIVYLVQGVLGQGFDQSGAGLSFLSPRSDVQFALGLQSNWMIRYAGEWWRILTAVFCHGGLIHLLFNASFLVWLGKDLEETFTPSGAVIVFFGSGLMGGFVSYLAPVNTVGASGALFGYLGALLYYAKGRGGVYGERLFKQVGTWTIYCFVFGLLVGANNWGHAGGFVGGGLVAHLIGWDHSRLRRTRGLLAVLCLLLFVVCWGLTAWHFSENLALIRAS